LEIEGNSLISTEGITLISGDSDYERASYTKVFNNKKLFRELEEN